MKKLIIAIIIVCTLTLSGCSIFNQIKEEMALAYELAENFCNKLTEEDIDQAKEMLHPQSNPSADQLEQYVSYFEGQHSIDFSAGVSFNRHTRFSASYYNSNYGGSVYEFNCIATIGSQVIELYFLVVKNDNGYGIYNFGVPTE